jgi:hypothetical protein
METIGIIIGIVSFVYAIYTNRKHSKLINYNREQAWEIYRQASMVLAAYQKLEKLNITDKNALTIIAKAEAHALELAFNSIKMIKRFEKKYSEETINKWVTEGKLDTHESHVQAFKKLIETE